MSFLILRAGGEVAGSTGQLIPSTQVYLNDKNNFNRFQTIIISFYSQARIVSTETGKDVQLGEAGELLVKGPQVKILSIIVSNSIGLFHAKTKQNF